MVETATCSAIIQTASDHFQDKLLLDLIQGTNLIDRIRTANQTPAPIDLELKLQRSGERIDLKLSHAATGTNKFKVQFIVFEDQLSNQVQAGENAGRKLDHQRVVRYLSQDLPLVNTAQHRIELDEQWDAANLGVAAIVRNHQDEYLQSRTQPSARSCFNPLRSVVIFFRVFLTAIRAKMLS